MKLQSFVLAVIVLTFMASPAHAGQRTSANYSVVAETADGGGSAGTSANYSNNGSAGTVAGIAAVASPAETVKDGYLAQLYDLTGTLTLTAPQTTVNETGTLQLTVGQTLDDATVLALPGGNSVWSVVSGPLTGIDANGLATAGAVYQNTAAVAKAVCQGQTLTLGLTVLDTIPDNYGSYAGDGIPDSWQVQYFGLNNPLAAPGVDASGTGQTNLFKYLAGLNPIDPASRFTLNISPVPGQPGKMNLIFSPRLSDRSYTVKSNAQLTATGWSAITASTPSDNGQKRTVTDLNATGSRKFYRVEITKP